MVYLNNVSRDSRLIKNSSKLLSVIGVAVTLISCNGGSSTSSASPSDQWTPLSVAYEIVNIATVQTNPESAIPTYKNGGANSITGAEWESYTPPSPYVKNSTRNLQFNEQIFISSPGQAPGVTKYITTEPDGYTWGAMSTAINAMYPFESNGPYAAYSNAYSAGNLVTTPAPGTIKVTANYKAQDMKWWAYESGYSSGKKIARYFITDPYGNQYIMHASNESTPATVLLAFESAVLPSGWTKQGPVYLTEDKILTPSVAPGYLYEYNVIRDSADNTYHQCTWGLAGISTVGQVQGMPIWGANVATTLRIVNSWNNLIYEGGGATLFIFDHKLTSGVNTIANFNPSNGDMLGFDGQTYTTQNTANGMQIKLSGGASILLSGISTFSTSWIQN